MEKVLRQVLEQVVPSDEERAFVARVAKQVVEKTERAAERVFPEADVTLQGSVAKDTWLSGDVDIDVFVLLPTKLTRDEFREIGLAIAREALRDYRVVERFAEHPYLEGYVEGLRVNVVPCYRVDEPGRWRSAADRTPYHTEYVLKRISGLNDEVRLLKRFMKGLGVYGAEIRVGGFSGYVCELLTIYFGGFLGVVEAASRWRLGQVVVDVEGYYRGREEELSHLFDSPVVVVDPVDKSRNAAAAVSLDKLAEFIAASKAFLKKPSTEFFLPQTLATELAQADRGFDILCLWLDGLNQPPDVVWGQLRKTANALQKLLRQWGFNVLEATPWTDERGSGCVLLALESSQIPEVEKRIGPPVDSDHAERFLQKHLNSPRLVRGPWIEGGRWVALVRRKYTNALQLLREKLARGGREHGVAGYVAEAIKKKLVLLQGEELVKWFLQKPELRELLTSFAERKPSWLRKNAG